MQTANRWQLLWSDLLTGARSPTCLSTAITIPSNPVRPPFLRSPLGDLIHHNRRFRDCRGNRAGPSQDVNVRSALTKKSIPKFLCASCNSIWRFEHNGPHEHGADWAWHPAEKGSSWSERPGFEPIVALTSRDLADVFNGLLIAGLDSVSESRSPHHTPPADPCDTPGR